MGIHQDGDRYDVVLIGSGVGGSVLATILARRGCSVLLLEAGSHPRFAIGESVVPEFGARAKLLSYLFDVPELAQIGNFQLLRHHVSANSGVKRNFSFLVHREGQEHRAANTSQFQAMTYPLGPDSHIYRPDLDSWLTNLAVRYGVTYLERSPVDRVELAEDEVRVLCGEVVHRARFVIDGSGYRSVLARDQGLRVEPDQATDSRTLFTHMVGVGSIHAARASGDPLGVPSPPDQGTLHHVFDGGWFWVIPFDNHAQGINHSCSVGLTLDRARHPDTGLDPETEFRTFAARFPTVARQFEGARAVRSWVKTGRVQYRSKRVSGRRWCLLPHAAGFVDALFSGGLSLSILGVNEVALLVLDALERDQFDDAGFPSLEESTRDNLQILDRMVHGAFVCFRSYELFNAWFRVWAVSNFYGSTGLIRLKLKWLETRDRSYLDALLQPPYRRLLGMDQPSVRALLDEAYKLVIELESGRSSEPETVDALYELLGRQDWIPPQFHITERERGHLASFSVLPLLSLIRWGKRHAPPEFRAAYFDVGPVFFRELLGAFSREGRRSAGSFWRVFRDAHSVRGRA